MTPNPKLFYEDPSIWDKIDDIAWKILMMLWIATTTATILKLTLH